MRSKASSKSCVRELTKIVMAPKVPCSIGLMGGALVHLGLSVDPAIRPRGCKIKVGVGGGVSKIRKTYLFELLLYSVNERDMTA